MAFPNSLMYDIRMSSNTAWLFRPSFGTVGEGLNVNMWDENKGNAPIWVGTKYFYISSTLNRVSNGTLTLTACQIMSCNLNIWGFWRLTCAEQQQDLHAQVLVVGNLEPDKLTGNLQHQLALVGHVGQLHPLPCGITNNKIEHHESSETIDGGES